MGAPKGNTNARKENRVITDALRRAVAQNPNKLKKACEAVLDKAVEGDLYAFNAIADRLDGKPAQTNVLEGSSENPIETVVREIVSSSNTDG